MAIPTELGNRPKMANRAFDYELTGIEGVTRYARVILKPLGSFPDRLEVELQAFEMTAEGIPASHPVTGEASRTPGTKHTIYLTGMGDTHTLVPGWVRRVGSFDPTAEPGTPTAAPPSTPMLDNLPVSGEVDQHVWVKGALYRWDVGEIRRVTEGKADELAGLLRNSESIGDFTL